MYTHTEIKVGEIITFGRYSQDDWETSPIEWIVLAKEEARVLLLSRYGLYTPPIPISHLSSVLTVCTSPINIPLYGRHCGCFLCDPLLYVVFKLPDRPHAP